MIMIEPALQERGRAKIGAGWLRRLDLRPPQPHSRLSSVAPKAPRWLACAEEAEAPMRHLDRANKAVRANRRPATRSKVSAGGSWLAGLWPAGGVPRQGVGVRRIVRGGWSGGGGSSGGWPCRHWLAGDRWLGGRRPGLHGRCARQYFDGSRRDWQIGWRNRDVPRSSAWRMEAVQGFGTIRCSRDHGRQRSNGLIGRRRRRSRQASVGIRQRTGRIKRIVARGRSDRLHRVAGQQF